MDFNLKKQWLRLRARQEHGVQRRPLDIDHEELPLLTCLNCGTEYRGNFCPNCGQRSGIHRLGWATAFNQMVGVLTNLESGFLRTCIDLFYRPGYLMRDYMRGRRTDYCKPMQMLVILATIHVLVHLVFFQNTGYHSFGELDRQLGEAGLQRTGSLLKDILENFCNNQAFSTLVFVVMLVVPNWLFFKRTRFGRNLNLIEHFYIMLYVGAQLMILNILQIPYARLFDAEENLSAFTTGYSFFVIALDFKQLMQISFRRSIALTLASMVLAWILFLSLVSLLSVSYVSIYRDELNISIQQSADSIATQQSADTIATQQSADTIATQLTE